MTIFKGVAKCGTSFGRPFLWGPIIDFNNGDKFNFSKNIESIAH